MRFGHQIVGDAQKKIDEATQAANGQADGEELAIIDNSDEGHTQKGAHCQSKSHTQAEKAHAAAMQAPWNDICHNCARGGADEPHAYAADKTGDEEAGEGIHQQVKRRAGIKNQQAGEQNQPAAETADEIACKKTAYQTADDYDARHKAGLAWACGKLLYGVGRGDDIDNIIRHKHEEIDHRNQNEIA